MARKKGTLLLGSNLEPEFSAPLDARQVVDSIADLTNGNIKNCYQGIKVYVKENKRVYLLTADTPSTIDNWTILGAKGDKGKDGKSAYDIAVDDGFTGTEKEWLTSLKGANGKDGADGKNGINGTNGQNGKDGKSAYEQAVDGGYTGTESEFKQGLAEINDYAKKEVVEQIDTTKIDRDTTPMVVIRFDLGGDRLFTNSNTGVSRNDIAYGEYGLKYTSAVQIQANGNIDISAENVKRLERQGCDCCLYSSYNNPYEVHGKDPTVLSDTSYEDEWKAYFADAVEKAKAVGIYYPTAWCSRYNFHGVAMDKGLKELNFVACIGNEYGQPIQILSDVNENTFVIPSYGGKQDVLGKIKSQINTCITQRKNMVLTTHEVYSTDEDAVANYSFTVAGLRELCAFLKEKQDNGLLKVVTISELARTKMGSKATQNDYQRLLLNINANPDSTDTDIDFSDIEGV